MCVQAAKEATRKRIEAMKKAPESPEAGDRGKGASLRVGKAAESAASAEARGPKRLSQATPTFGFRTYYKRN